MPNAPSDPTDLPPAESPTESSTQAPARTDTAAVLLLRALDSLQEDERRQVLGWLLERVPRALTGLASITGMEGLPPSPTAATLRGGEEDAVRAALAGAQLSETSRGGLQMVPVRLPTDQHARLRAWCQEHGFAMATVIRGLLARFLDERQPGPVDGDPGQTR
ncbi:hypothetical protein [Actinopolymorpha pittospori]